MASMALNEGTVAAHPSAGDPVLLTIELRPAGSDRAGYVASATVGDRPPVTGSFEPPAQTSNPAEERAAVTADGASITTTDAAADAGIALFDALFAGKLRRCWAQAVADARDRGLRLVVRSVDLAVHGLPWELLFDRVLINRYVIHADGWSVVRSVPDPPKAPAPRKRSSELTVLVMLSGMVGVDTERDLAAIQDAWPDASIAVLRGAGAAEVAAALAAGVDVLHIAATGVELADGRQYLALGGSADIDPMSDAVLVSAAELLEMINGAPERRRPRLVALAGCDTDVLAAELAWDIPAVLGVRGTVSDKGVAAFVQGFYQALGSGGSVADGLSAGRIQQRTFASSFGAEWAAPVGFLTAAQRLVAPAAQIPSPSPPRDPTVTPANGRVELELEMRTLDLDALLERWGPVDERLWPDLVTRQRGVLTAEIADAAHRLGRPR